MKLGKNAGTAAVLAYFTQGVLGLPIFANGNLAVAHLISPTGGYLLAFVPSAYFSGLIVKLGSMRKSVLGFFIILVGILITGTFWLSIFCDFKTAFYNGFISFLPGAVIKTLLAVMLLPVLE
ncbi:MAG: biotin transporter BioY [Candidatus Cloacimonadota bacterium]|nr:biotin transporter BioY [Candidatus Cloacimonadota bacterium]